MPTASGQRSWPPRLGPSSAVCRRRRAIPSNLKVPSWCKQNSTSGSRSEPLWTANPPALDWAPEHPCHAPILSRFGIYWLDTFAIAWGEPACSAVAKSGDVWAVCDIAPNPLALGPQNFVLSGCRLRECSAAGSRHLLHLEPVRVLSEADKMEDDTTIECSKSIPVRKFELPVAHDKHVRGIGKPRHACLDGLPAHGNGNVSRTDVCPGIKRTNHR